MKKLICLLLALMLFAGCAANPVLDEPVLPPQQEVPSVQPSEEEPPLPAGVQTLGGELCYVDHDTRQKRVFDAGIHVLDGLYYRAETQGTAIVPIMDEVLLMDDGVYYVNQEGALLTDADHGYLHFDADGRYTSGNTELDAQIEQVLAASGALELDDTEDALRAVYNYIRDNYKYISMDIYETGSTDWAEEATLRFLKYGKGNCYCFAGLFMYCARRLGYQAYVIAGNEYTPDNAHAWTMIDWTDGETYLFDVELEYAYWYMYKNKPKIDMFKQTGENGLYNGCQYYFP